MGSLWSSSDKSESHNERADRSKEAVKRLMNKRFDVYRESKSQAAWQNVWAIHVGNFEVYADSDSNRSVFKEEVARFKTLAETLPQGRVSFADFLELRDAYCDAYAEGHDQTALVLLRSANDDMQALLE
jgi:hypothetical protein